MATIFPNLNGYTITGFSAISGSGTVPAGKAYIIFSYTVSIPLGGASGPVVGRVDSYGPGTGYTVGPGGAPAGYSGTGFYFELSTIPAINAL